MNWKKISLWSGLGGIAFGTAVYALKKKSDPKPQFFPEAIPRGLRQLWIELAPFPTTRPDRVKAWNQSCFVCEPTSFYIWNVLPNSRVESHAGKPLAVSRNEAIQIFFVVPILRQWLEGEQPPADPGQVGEGFYATLRVGADLPRKSLSSRIARDFPLEFRKCLVGGGPNGIETGEILRTPQPVVSYRFDLEEA